MVRFGKVEFNFSKKIPGTNETADSISFKSEINITQDGWFRTTIPQDAVAFLEERGIKPDRNIRGNKGYYQERDLESLRELISKDFKDALSCEMIEEKLVIKYGFITNISFCKNKKGEPVPNGMAKWTETDDYQWINGNMRAFENRENPIGLNYWAKLYNKKTYKLKSGKVFSEYELATKIAENSGNQTMHYFSNIISNSGRHFNEKFQEIEYSDEVAEMFISLFKAFCNIIEKFNELDSPEKLLKIAESRIKLIG